MGGGARGDDLAVLINLITARSVLGPCIILAPLVLVLVDLPSRLSDSSRWRARDGHAQISWSGLVLDIDREIALLKRRRRRGAWTRLIVRRCRCRCGLTIIRAGGWKASRSCCAGAGAGKRFPRRHHHFFASSPEIAPQSGQLTDRHFARDPG